MGKMHKKTNLRKPVFSIVIPSLNAEQSITKCLTSISNLDFPKDKYEVILVDNGSKDKTLEIAKKFKVTILSAPKAKIPKLRNIGIQKANGKIIASTDSDCIVDKDWLKNALPYFQNKKIAMAGYECSVPKNPSIIESMWVDALNVKKGFVNKLPSGNFIFRKDIWKKVGKFDSSLTAGEDPEFCYRIIKAGYKIMADPKIKVTHLGFPKTLREFIRKQYWYGSHTLKIAFKHGFKIRQFKILILTLWSFIALVGLLLSLLSNRDIYYTASFFLFMCIPPLLLSFVAVIRSRKIFSFPLYFIIFLTYNLVRGMSIITHSIKRT
ncbi:MAG: glycosyltransferase [Nanoarchaeota archaeon]|nr:glycosyltransferase [Nanoarchaeota archaeon]